MKKIFIIMTITTILLNANAWYRLVYRVIYGIDKVAISSMIEAYGSEARMLTKLQKRLDILTSHGCKGWTIDKLATRQFTIIKRSLQNGKVYLTRGGNKVIIQHNTQRTVFYVNGRLASSYPARVAGDKAVKEIGRHELLNLLSIEQQMRFGLITKI